MRMFRAPWRALTMAAAVAVSFLLASCAPAGPAGGAGTAASGSGVITLNKISTLKSLFNRDDGHTRLILIFSPT